MSAYKQFLASDIIITPFEINKGFTFYGSELISSTVSIDRFLGQNITSSLFEPGSEPTTGYLSTQYQRLIYNSIAELYYSNYLSSSYGDQASLPILVPGRDPAGNRYIGSSSSTAYDNYLQTTLTYPRYFPTYSDAYIAVISIPVRVFGDYIQPSTLKITFPFNSETFEFYDDGEGNLRMLNNIYGTSSAIVGNVIYPHGIVTLTGNLITSGCDLREITCNTVSKLHCVFLLCIHSSILSSVGLDRFITSVCVMSNSV